MDKREMYRLPSSIEQAVTSMPEGKANKELRDIWIEKSSVRRNDERTLVLYSITSGLITKNETEPLRRAFTT